MKRILLMMSFVVCAGYTLWGDPACPTTESPLSGYVGATFVCGDLTFSDLKYSASGTLPTDISQVEVTFVTVGGEEGLQFNAPWIAFPTQTTDSTFSFDATCNDGCSIDDLALTIGGAAAGPGGGVNVAENSAPLSGALEVGVIPGTSILSDKQTFTPVTSLSVVKDLAVIGGTSGLGSSVSQVQNLFSTTSSVPEPSLVFLCVGLLGLLPVARRKFGF